MVLVFGEGNRLVFDQLAEVILRHRLQVGRIDIEDFEDVCLFLWLQTIHRLVDEVDHPFLVSRKSNSGTLFFRYITLSLDGINIHDHMAYGASAHA